MCFLCGLFLPGIFLISPVGDIGQYCKMPRKSQKSRKLVRKEHIKFESLSPHTVKKYRTAVNRFGQWLRGWNIPAPRNLRELDHYGGEFVNFLYQDDRPLNWATDFQCGLKRLHPFCRRYLDATNQYCRNWCKAVVRKRACPLPWAVVQAMISLAMLETRHELALVLYLGFAGLFGAGELINMLSSQISVVSESVAVISLAEFKTAVRIANAESVIIKDRCLIQLLVTRMRNRSPASRLYSGSYGSLAIAIKDYAAFLGLEGNHVTPHSLRRGGATWHFRRCQNLDVVQTLGRWAQARTAKLYIDEAMSEFSAAEASSHQDERLKGLAARFPKLIKKLLRE